MSINLDAENVDLMLLVLAHIVVAIIVGWLAGQLFNLTLGRLAQRTKNDLDSKLVKVSKRPLSVVVFIIVLQIARDKLSQFPHWVGSPVFDWLNDFIFVIGVVVASLWLVAVINTLIDWYLTNIAHRTKTALDELFLPLLRKVSSIIIYFLAITVILSHFNINVTGLIATAGVASLAIALAAQDTLSNMLAGFTILSDRPFREGDRIELASGIYGDVYHIGLRSTKILTRENTLVTIPNKDIANAVIINHMLPDGIYRISTTVGVAYGTDLHKVKAIIFDILKSLPEVLDEPKPTVFFLNFGDSSLDLSIRFYIADARHRRRVTDIVHMAIKDRFEAEGIEIPFPQRDVHIISHK
ncbi:MAG: mechanosensitive ion channel [Peptococcaceae bacterium]|nr:mechanosensitive ion channel [Peptococcaceae bacterium]